ncbi:hypothetical protein ACSFA7_22560 [Variovorax sp. LT1R20]|uniref:hypothetical protein n=1 Tax=Variovorax sp. LT1R20 TaxID=3443729 RepID=UPI003F480390
MASGFRHDAAGFLVGEIVESNRDLMRAQTQGVAIWKTIRNDVKAIARAVGAEVSNNVRMSRPGAVPRAPSVRTSGGNYVGGPRAAVAQPAARGAPAQRSAVSRASAAVVVAQPRGTNGRFVAGQRPARGGGDGGGSSGRTLGRMNDVLGKLASSLQVADNVDPMLNAAKEIKDVVSPLGRGLFSLLGRTAERKKERWYQRILKALAPGSQKAQQQQGGGGFFGMGADGGMLGSLLGTAGGSAAGGLLGALLGKGGKLLKGGGGLLRRIPILGALLAGGGALASIFGGGTRDEKFRGVGEAGGMLAGGLTGAKGGALLGAFGGPIGAVVGALLGGAGGMLLGERFGAQVGLWTKSLVDADLPGKAAEAFKVATAAIGAAWGSLSSDAKAAWDDITTKASQWLDSARAGLDSVGKTLGDAGNAINTWVEGKTGINMKGAAGSAATSVSNAAGSAWDATKNAASAGWSAAKGYGSDALDAAKVGAAAMVPNTVKRAYDAGAAAASKAGSAVRGAFKGAEARAQETGKAYAAGNIGGLDDAQTRALVASTALTESGGGKLDVVNKLGFAGRYQAGAGWLADAGLIKGGASAVRAAMKADGYTREADWGKAGGMTRFLKDDKNWNGGMTYDGFLKSASVQDAAFKTNSDATYRSLMKSGTINANTPQAEVAGLLKARHLAGLGGAMAVARGGTGAVDANGTSAKKYFNDVALDKNGFNASYRGVVSAGSTASMLASSSVPSSVPATIPKAAEVRDPAVPLNGAGAGRGTINISTPEVIGQNVSDRGIAHIASGGLGGGATGGW